MLYTKFSVAMGLIDTKYTHTKLYCQLHVNLAVCLSVDQV